MKEFTRTTRGIGLLELIGGMFVSALVLAIVVPLYVAAQRSADLGLARSRVSDTARRLTHQMREDVRQAAEVRVVDGGVGLTLDLRRNPRELVRYRRAGTGLVRESHFAAGGGRAGQFDMYAALREVRFSRQGAGVRAQLFFEDRVRGRRIGLATECVAAPRIGDVP
jgi:hypothetical protein